ncbi:MAG: Crp/Fnr family transcriptional regulator [Burkholderiaceae bacterium]
MRVDRTLQSTSPTAALPPNIAQLAALGTPRRYRKGTLLIEEGDHGDTLFVILKGRLRAYATGPNEREITFGVYGPGEYVGEMSLDGGPRSANVITLEASECAVITRETLKRHIAANPEFALELLAKVIRRARLATESSRNMALIDVYGRLTRLLESLAVTQPDGTRVITERLTHQEIANRVGCSREMVSRLIKDLETSSHLSAAKGQLTLRGNLPTRW